jgi:catechol 2,3-dioxygenase-like lactoylglutathione lyase family enzyme
MRKLQSQGVHHITIVGANRQTSIDFWEGVLGMPFVFEQPNLDNESESHLYFDPGDGRLITVFTNEERAPDPERTSTGIGAVHHVAFSLSQATFRQAVERLDERGIRHSGVKDRGFMDSIYFEDPLGLLIELASYRFEPPHGHTHADVCSPRTSSGSRAATTTSTRRTWPTRSRSWPRSRARSRTTGRRRTPTARRTPWPPTR